MHFWGRVARARRHGARALSLALPRSEIPQKRIAVLSHSYLPSSLVNNTSIYYIIQSLLERLKSLVFLDNFATVCYNKQKGYF